MGMMLCFIFSLITIELHVKGQRLPLNMQQHSTYTCTTFSLHIGLYNTHWFLFSMKQLDLAMLNIREGYGSEALLPSDNVQSLHQVYQVSENIKRQMIRHKLTGPPEERCSVLSLIQMTLELMLKQFMQDASST